MTVNCLVDASQAAAGCLGHGSRSCFAVATLVACLGCGAQTSDLPTPGYPLGGAELSQAVRHAPTILRCQDVTERTGIDFRYRNGQEAGHHSILETVGGGVGLLDYDGDHDLDIFLPGGGEFGPNREISGKASALYRNDGAWSFTEVSQEAGCAHSPHYSHGVAVGDYDSDGFCDFVLTGYGGVVLYHNLGDGTYEATTSTARLLDASWSTSGAWGDVNGDGHLDLYLTHYVDWTWQNNPPCRAAHVNKPEVCSPRRFRGIGDTLFLSDGAGSFEDQSQTTGLRPDGKGLGALMGDIDLDGDLDIYVANDTTANFLYRNDGRGQVEEIGMMSATGYGEKVTPDGSMGVDLGDFDGNGLPDIWVTNFENESFALYANTGAGFFRHASRMAGISNVGGLYVGWGTAFSDFDNDGDEDLIVSNGHVLRHPLNAPVRQTPLLFENRSGRYVNVAFQAGQYMAEAHEGRGLAVGDLDDDGDMDVVISHMNEPVVVLSNETKPSGQWIGFRLVGVQSHRDAVGAAVYVTCQDRKQMKQICGGGSYLSANDLRLMFGLGRAAQADTVEIHWPSGVVQQLNQLSAGRVHAVVELSSDERGRSF